jgi:hypothetical protein
MIGSTLGASGGTFAAATAATATTAATSAGIGNVVLSAAIASMTSSAFTGLATGNFDAQNVLKAGLVAGLTAGLTNWLAPTATSGISLGAAVNWAERAAISAGVNTVVNGADFGESFLNSFVTNAAAGAANWIGDNAGTGELLGEVGSFGHVAAHAILGCATAAATDRDCADGAVGGAMSAFLTSFLNAPTNADGTTRAWTDDEKLLITAGSTLVGGLVVGAMGGDAETGISAAQNEVQNNFLSHPEAKRRSELENEKRACGDDACRLDRQRQINAINELDLWRDAQIKAACESPSSPACQAWNSALQTAARSYNGQRTYGEDSSLLAEQSSVQNDAYMYGVRSSNPYLYGIGKGLLKLTPPALVMGTGVSSYELTTALMDEGLVDTAINIARGVAGLPANLRDRLNSTDPSVRGEASVDALALGAVSTAVVAKAPQVATRIKTTARATLERVANAISPEQRAALNAGKGPLTAEAAANEFANGGSSAHPLEGLTFDEVVERAIALGLNTPKDRLLLWSGFGKEGPAIAQTYARDSGGITMEMTSGGSWLSKMDLYGANSPFTQAEADLIWAKASDSLVNQASGQVRSVLGEVRPTNIYLNREVPGLQMNPAVFGLDELYLLPGHVTTIASH